VSKKSFEMARDIRGVRATIGRMVGQIYRRFEALARSRRRTEAKLTELEGELATLQRLTSDLEQRIRSFRQENIEPRLTALEAGRRGASGTASPLTTKGDIHGYDTASARVPIGTDTHVLTADSAESLGLKWAAAPGSSPLTTKGDIHGYDTASARVPIGTDTHVLTADSAQSLGLKWAAVPETSPLTTKGDIHGYDTASTRVPIGTDTHVLTADSAQALGLKWAAAPGIPPLTTKGDLYGYDTAAARIPVGTDDYVLTADSAQALGVKWAVAPGAGPSSWTSVVQASDDSSSDTTFIDSDLTFTPAGSRTYLIHCFILLESDATARGVKLKIVHPTSGLLGGASTIRQASSTTAMHWRNSVETTDYETSTPNHPGAASDALSVIDAMLITDTTPSGAWKIQFCSENATGTVKFKAESVLLYREIT
jgi:hypothetical protein